MKNCLLALSASLFALPRVYAFEMTTNQAMIEQMTTDQLPLDKIDQMFAQIF